MRKHHILYIVVTIFILSSVFIENNSVSALSYSSNVDIGFTFNPTLSINISPSNLVISNLIPGSTFNSNNINVGVSTNTAYGYTLSATVGSNDVNSPYHSSDLVHSNGNDLFNSIATDADLSSLTVDNTWGYSYKDNTVVSPTWSNYSGLSNINSKTLLDNSNMADSTGSIDFKIGARASNAQASGTYTNTINFTAVAKPAPVTLLDAFIASGVEQSEGYFKMQDMTSSICNSVDVENSELQLIDIRDKKIYWVAKLRDGNCWMTQNLDFNITAGATNITSDNTDLSTDQSVYTATNTIYALKGENDVYGYTYGNGVATWIPERDTIAYNNLSANTWQNSDIDPYSYDRQNTSTGAPVYPDNNVPQSIAEDHGLSGNYYNWTAAIASNDSSNATNDASNSICPKSWRLPSVTNKEFGNLLAIYNVIEKNTSTVYLTNVNSMGAAPLYFIRSGAIDEYAIFGSGASGSYWSNLFENNYGTRGGRLYFNNSNVYPQDNDFRKFGHSIRCIAK